MIRSILAMMTIRLLIVVLLATRYSMLSLAVDSDLKLSSVELIAIGSLDGTEKDLSMVDMRLEEGTPANQVGGFSAIEYSGQGDLYWVLSDRGPADGAASYPCRIQQIKLNLDFASKEIEPKVVATVLLRNDSDAPLLGSLSSLPSERFNRGDAFDPEGLRTTTNREFIICDEYGPSIELFAMNGRRLKSWSLPPWMALTRETDLKTASDGTMPNRGLEGLAIAADGLSMVAAMQGPLIQDSESEGKKRYGGYTRLIQVFFAQDTPMRHVLYPLAHRASGISEILNFGPDQYLVLERDGELRPEAKYKSIYLADLSQASDVASMEVPCRDLPSSIQACRKVPFIDLLEPRWAIPEKYRMEKPEGLAWGPPLEDGRRLLIVCFDNDFHRDVESLFLAFAVP